MSFLMLIACKAERALLAVMDVVIHIGVPILLIVPGRFVPGVGRAMEALVWWWCFYHVRRCRFWLEWQWKREEEGGVDDTMCW